MNKKLKIILISILLMIILCTVCFGTIHILGDNNETVVTGEGKLPEGYFCENHGWQAAAYYKCVSSKPKEFSNNTELGLMSSYIFGSNYSEKVKQNAYWKTRAEIAKNCKKPVLDEDSKTLYYKAKNYADLVMNSGLGKESLKDANATERTIKNGKYYYDFAVIYNEKLSSSKTIDTQDGGESFLGKVELGTLVETAKYYKTNKDTGTKVEIHKIKLQFGYTDAAIAKIKSNMKIGTSYEDSLYIIDEYGMQHDLDISGSLENWKNKTTGEVDNYYIAEDGSNLVLLQKNKKNNYVRVCNIKDTNGKNSAEIAVTYEKLNPDKEELSDIGFGDHESDYDSKIFYIKTIEIEAIGKDGKKINKKYTKKADVESILKENDGNKLLFETEVDENLYEAVSVKIKINYEYCSYEGTYTEYEGCTSDGELTGSNTQRLIHPEIEKTWNSESIELSIGEGNRYVNLEIDKYEGSKANEVTDENLLKGATFTINKGEFKDKKVAQIATITYENAKKLFKSKEFETSKSKPQTRTEWKIEDSDKFNWNEIKLSAEDITRGYVVFKVTETPPDGYIGINEFYVLAEILDVGTDNGDYSLKNMRIIYDEVNDKDKIVFKNSGQSTSDTHTINPVINVTNIKAGKGSLQLLKTDNKNTPINDVKFDVTVTRYKNGEVKGKDETFTLTTENNEIAIGDFLNIAGKVDGVAEHDLELADIDKIKFTVKEQDHTKNNKLPDYLDVIPEFTMEFGVKVDDGTYVISDTYINETKDTYTKAFKYNGNIVNFNKLVGEVDSYVDSENNIAIGIKNPNTKEATIRLIAIDDTTAFSLDLTKTDVGTSKIVEDAGFDIKVTKVDKNNYDNEKGVIYQNKETLYSDASGKIAIKELSNISLKNIDVDNEYIKVTITETIPPKVEGNGYYELVNEGKPFSFIASAKKNEDKVELENIIEKIEWPSNVDGIKGYADEPSIDDSKLSINVNIKDKYNDEEDDEGKFGIKILKKDLDSELISEAKNPAEFQIKINDKLIKNNNPVAGKEDTIFVATNGLIELDGENYSELKLNSTQPQIISIRETKAPDVDGDGVEDYKKINNGDWFTATVKVEKKGKIYRLNGEYIKDTTWPTSTSTNKANVNLDVVNDYAVTFDVENESILDGEFNIELIKTDKAGKKLKNAEFAITVKADNKDIHSGTYTTDSQGKLSINGIKLEAGMKEIKVYFKETKAPSGYKLVNEGKEFYTVIKVEETNKYLRIANENENHDCPDDVQISVENNNKVIANVIDHKETEEIEGEYDISIHKVREGKATKSLKDAWFRIKVIHGDTTDTIKNPNPVAGIDDDIFITDENGNITTGKIKLQLGKDGKPETQYVEITEVKAPAGYLPINDGAPIQVTLKVKKEGNKLVLDESTNHVFFPADYKDKVTDNNYAITELPETPIKYELKFFKQFKDNDGTVRTANFEVTDEINKDDDGNKLVYDFKNVDTSGENSQKLEITENNKEKIKLRIKEISNVLNTGWGTIPEFYLEIPTTETSSGSGSYKIDRSKEIKVTPVNSSDTEIFELIKQQLLKITLSSDGTAISIVAINPLEGNINIKLNKVDASANNAAIKGMKFKVTVSGADIQGGSTDSVYTTDSDGTLTIPNIKITSASGQVELKVHELTYEEGNEAIKYYKEIPDFTITLYKTLMNQTYTVKDEYTTSLGKNSDVKLNMSGDDKNKQINIIVPNERRIMRLSGQVWKDVPSSGKTSEVDGQKQDTEPFINGITVKIHASDGSDILTKYQSIVESTEKKTQPQKVNGENKEGYYYFDVPMYDGGYYIEYVYNGYIYQHTKYTPWDGKKVFSNATETEKDRDDLNNKFAIINSSSVNNQINNTTETDTSYSGVEIGISAFTGGFGKEKLATFSARKYDDSEGKCDNRTGTNNSSKYVGGALKNQTIDGKTYDYVYDNIDLGITARETVRMKLAKAVDTVKFKVEKPTGEIITQSYKGKKYGGEDDYIGEIEIGVRKEDEYTYSESGDSEGRASDVHTYITYRLHLTNNSSQIGVQINDIVDYFDDSLELQSVILANEDGSKISDIAYTTNKENKALRVYDSKGQENGSKTNFKELHITPNLKIPPTATYYIDVTFEMPTEPKNIIQSSDTDEVKESKIKTNIAEINSYSTYYVENGLNNGNQYSYNEHKENDIAGLVDQESNPGNVIGIKKTGIATRPYLAYPHEKDDGIAFAKFIEKEERELSGKVWIENRNKNDEDTQGANIGDGELKSGEIGYQGVKVNLYDADTNAIAYVYYDGYGDENKWGEATEKTTDSNGNYEAFKGIAPGNYYLLFTYPDGQTYKSTIFAEASQSTFDVNNPDEISSAIFDLNSNDNKSHARDIQGNESTANTRKYVNSLLAEGEINNNATVTKDIKSDYDTYINGNDYIKMNAASSMLKLGFETDRNNTDENVGTTYYDSLSYWGGITWEYSRKNTITNINLGVVERPINQLQITKKVDNVKLTLANGSTLFDATKRATNVQWIKEKEYEATYTDGKLNAIDNSIDTSIIPNIAEWRKGTSKGQINLTMDEELMQGATIKIKYNIKVTNIGEIDYKDNKFYYLGIEDNNDANIVKTQINEVVDYVGYQSVEDDNNTRNNLNFLETENDNSSWERTTAEKLESDRKLSQNAAYGKNYDSTTPDKKSGASAYSTIVINNLGNKSLNPKLMDENSTECYAEQAIILSKMISSSSRTDDLTYNNMVEITKLTNEVGRRTRYSTVGNQDPTDDRGPLEVDTDEANEVTITPPYGQTQIPYFLYAGIALIMILGVSSIIIIRKKTAKDSNKE